jgi:copper transport protein
VTAGPPGGRPPSSGGPPRRRAVLLLSTLLLFLALPVLTAGPASAHATLQESVPNDGAIVSTQPTQVLLKYDESVEAALGGITVLAADGSSVTVGKVHHVAGAGSQVAIGLRASLPDGSYLVNWRVQSADSHVIEGALTFSVGEPGALATAATPDTAGVVQLLALARFAGYVGIMLALGSFAFLALCWPTGWTDPTTRILMWAGLGTSITTTVLALLLQGAYATGTGLSGVLRAGLLTDTADTRFGHTDLVRLVLLLTIAATLRLSLPTRSSSLGRRTQIGVAAGLVMVIATFALAGHAGGGSRVWLYLPLDVVHLSAISVWMGGLLALFLALVRRRTRNSHDDGLSAALARFSRLALLCVAVLVVSGSIEGWREVGTIGALFHTSYGLLLVAKVAGLGLILGCAAASRAAVTRHFATPGKRLPPLSELSALRVSAGSELALGVVVIALASTLVSVAPARTQYRPSTQETVVAGPVTLDVAVHPSGPRTVAVRLTPRDKKGAQRTLAEFRTTVRLPGRGITVPLKLHRTAAGYVAKGVEFPVAGKWQLQMYVRTTDIDAYSVNAPLTVR